MSDYGWTDIVKFVEEVRREDGSRPNRTHYRMLGDKALSEISTRMGLVSTSWTNTAGGPITLTGNTVSLPTDMVRLLSVAYDDVVLTSRGAKDMDDDYGAEWRDETGDPMWYVIEGNSIVLNSAPSGATGKLVVRGTGTLPKFSDDESAENPLAYIPQAHQLAVAYYILANLPIRDDADAVNQQQYQMKWMEELRALDATTNRRRYEPFTI